MLAPSIAYLHVIWQLDSSLPHGIPFEFVSEFCKQLNIAQSTLVLEEIRASKPGVSSPRRA